MLFCNSRGTLLFFCPSVTLLLILEGAAVQEHCHKGKRKFRIDRDELCFTTCHPHYHPPLTDVRGMESMSDIFCIILVSFSCSIVMLIFPVLRMDMTSSADYQPIL